MSMMNRLERPVLKSPRWLVGTVKTLLSCFCYILLTACESPRKPLPEPYVAVKGQPYYWEVGENDVLSCAVRSETEGHGYRTGNYPCRFTHDGNFNTVDLEGAKFLLNGSVIMESAVPLWGPFGPFSSYDKRISLPVKIRVVEPDAPMLQKCSRVDYQKMNISYDYPKNAVAYDCSKKR